MKDQTRLIPISDTNVRKY